MASMIPYDRYSRALRNWPFDEIDRFFDAPFSALSTGNAGFKMNVEDAGDAYVVTAELPGVTREQIDVEKKETEEEKGKNYLYKESGEWSATRGVFLKDAATAGLTARLEGGILTVNVPKQQEKANVTKVSID